MERFHGNWEKRVGSKRKAALGSQAQGTQPARSPLSGGALCRPLQQRQPADCNAGVLDNSDEDENIFQHFANTTAL